MLVMCRVIAFNLYRPNKSARSKVTHPEQRVLDGKNGLLLTLVILRTGVAQNLAASLFGISEFSVTSYFTTWISALSKFFQINQPFPEQAEVVRCTPVSFLNVFGDVGGRVRIVVDSTNLNIDNACDPDAAGGTHSRYYAGTVAKYLICMTPGGSIVYVSLPYPGKITDTRLHRETVERMGLVDVGEAEVVDKGFRIAGRMYSCGVHTLMPVMQSCDVVGFTGQQINQSRQIAKERAHIERAVRRMKSFKILNGSSFRLDRLDILPLILQV
jgi:hypothetical protein